MPIYDYECANCGVKYDVWAPIYRTELTCDDCKCVMWRIPSPTNVICDIEPYLDGHMAQNPVPVHSRQHKKEELKKRGLFIK